MYHVTVMQSGRLALLLVTVQRTYNELTKLLRSRCMMYVSNWQLIIQSA